MTAYRFENRNNVSALFAGQNCAAVNKDAGPVHAGYCNTTRGHIFVAAANGHKAVKTLGAHNGFNGVGDDLA